ncbi:MAG TPA: hypothetical protein VJI68_00065 [Candidatus Nanoarchaeia archaeon]|nr:hypothetical protein [Candidatus Nanoarchaeia archaeon]
MQLKNKKGDIEFDTIIKLIVAVICLLIAISLIYFFKDKSLAIIDSIKDILRFGK